MEDLDLDAFIANIEQTAPQETNLDETRPFCNECNVPFENVDGDYICPICSVQATNILQLEETELHFDETGNVILGQRAGIAKKPRHSIDYGWAWSTDEAIVHILSSQITCLENVGLVPHFFRDAITNMWFKFWLENLAPFIKDEYQENELIPITTSKALKLRDIEVLVKVKDKVMIPAPLVGNNRVNPRKRPYKMLNAHFYEERPESGLDDNFDTSSEDDLTSSSSICTPRVLSPEGRCTRSSAKRPLVDVVDQQENTVNTQGVNPPQVVTTRNLGINSISILTLNRTLAFIEATARCLNLADPLFASDIIRATVHRLIPFFGAHKTLPEGIKLNYRDKLMFQKSRPPTPFQLTRTASLLLHKIYQDKLPITIPVPDLDRILERFIDDMNLPHDFLNHILANVDFDDFDQTKPRQLTSRRTTCLPQYDRWAFAMLLCQLKKTFNLQENYIASNSQAAINESIRTGEKYFILKDWIVQMRMRIKLVLSYDPFVLFHPVASMRNIQTTPQIYRYIECTLGDRARTTTRTKPVPTSFEETFRLELTDFLKREIPRPPGVKNQLADIDDELDRSIDIRHPIKDGLKRTKRFWISDIENRKGALELLYRDFSCDKVCCLAERKTWCIYDDGVITKMKLDISPKWPEAFKLLLTVGGFLCFCEPKELLNEVKFVEEFFYPESTYFRKKKIRQSMVKLIKPDGPTNGVSEQREQ